MSHLWIPLETGGHGVLVLEQAEYELPVRPQLPATDAPAPATLVRLAASDGWAVVARSEHVRVNGIALPAGLAVLADRDEIQLPGVGPVWFSTEIVARVVEAPALDGRTPRCPRCREPIEAGSPAVLCAGCRVWYHQTPARPCYTYQDAPCSACGELCELDGDFRWSPEEL